MMWVYRMECTRIKECFRTIDELAWCGKADIFNIAKAAKSLGRSYTEDIADRKRLMIDLCTQNSEAEQEVTS